MEPADFYHDCLGRWRPRAPSQWPAIEAAYADRAYHNLDHLREMLQHYRNLPSDLHLSRKSRGENTPAIFGLALIYHDIVYVAGRSDNEARSAEELVTYLMNIGTTENEVKLVRRLIMATKSHQPSINDSGEEALLIDLDLAVLARPAAGYDAYAKAVRKEFRLFPNFLYKPGRRKALQHFLEQPNIYHTLYFRNSWEGLARENLNRELADRK